MLKKSDSNYQILRTFGRKTMCRQHFYSKGALCMSMLDRYKKAGGFVQLLNLIETCGPAKKEKFLEMIKSEDPLWCDEIQKKMLDIHKVMNWPQEALAEIVPLIPEPVWGGLMHGLQPAEIEKLRSVMNHSLRRKVDDHFGTSKPTPPELSSLMVRVLTDVRNLITQNKLHVKKFAPELFIEDEIEEKLKKAAAPKLGVVAEVAVGASTEPADGAKLNFDMAEKPIKGDAVSAEEYQILRRKCFSLTQENQELKNEIARLNQKVTQIKKLVA